MYDQEQTQSTQYAAPVGMLASKASPLQAAINEQGEQLAKLHELLLNLGERLGPVRSGVPTNESSQQAQEPGGSMLTAQISRQTDMVKNTQRLVDMLLHELEV